MTYMTGKFYTEIFSNKQFLPLKKQNPSPMPFFKSFAIEFLGRAEFSRSQLILVYTQLCYA